MASIWRRVIICNLQDPVPTKQSSVEAATKEHKVTWETAGAWLWLRTTAIFFRMEDSLRVLFLRAMHTRAVSRLSATQSIIKHYRVLWNKWTKGPTQLIEIQKSILVATITRSTIEAWPVQEFWELLMVMMDKWVINLTILDSNIKFIVIWTIEVITKVLQLWTSTKDRCLVHKTAINFDLSKII